MSSRSDLASTWSSFCMSVHFPLVPQATRDSGGGKRPWIVFASREMETVPCGRPGSWCLAPVTHAGPVCHTSRVRCHKRPEVDGVVLDTSANGEPPPAHVGEARLRVEPAGTAVLRVGAQRRTAVPAGSTRRRASPTWAGGGSPLADVSRTTPSTSGRWWHRTRDAVSYTHLTLPTN